MVALFVLTMIVIIQRFYKGLLCDEGYLMFTLPVKPWQLIATKWHGGACDVRLSAVLPASCPS